MRLVLQVVADESIIILVLVCQPYQSILPYLCGYACLAVPERIVMAGVVLVGAVDIDKYLDTVLLALLYEDIEYLHTVLHSLAVRFNEILVDVCVGTCGSYLTVLTYNVLGRSVGSLY